MSFNEAALPSWVGLRPRSQPEAILRYNIAQPCVLMGDIWVTAAGACTYTAEANVIPAGDANYYLFVVPKVPIGDAQIVVTVNGEDYGSGPKSGTATIPALATYDAASIVSGGDGWGAISTVTCTGGTANDELEIWAVPDFDQFTRWRYLQSFDLDNSPFMMPVADGFEPAYAAIKVRRGASLTFNRNYVDYTDSFDKIRGRDVTLLIDLHPEGGSLVSEYIIIANGYLSATQNAGDNALVISAAEGGDRKVLRYTPTG